MQWLYNFALFNGIKDNIEYIVYNNKTNYNIEIMRISDKNNTIKINIKEKINIALDKVTNTNDKTNVTMDKTDIEKGLKEQNIR